MEGKIRNYIESVFRDVPKTEHSETIKNEILQNLIDKYHDLKNEGRNDEEAYAIAISSGGDLSDIVADLKNGTASSDKIHQKIQQNVNYGHKYRYRILKKEKKKLDLFSSVFWPSIVLVYFIYSMLIDGAWSYSWIIWIIAPCIASLYKFITVKSNEKVRNNALSSAVWTGITSLYFIVSFATERWGVTWLIFIFGIAVSNIAKAAVRNNYDDDDDDDDTYVNE